MQTRLPHVEKSKCILSNINTVIHHINYVVRKHKLNTPLMLHLQLNVYVTRYNPPCIKRHQYLCVAAIEGITIHNACSWISTNTNQSVLSTINSITHAMQCNSYMHQRQHTPLLTTIHLHQSLQTLLLSEHHQIMEQMHTTISQQTITRFI